jgi:hypothetical protein
VELAHIDDEDLLDLGQGQSIYSKEQLEKFLQFQDSKGTKRVHLMETVELTNRDVAQTGPGDWDWGSV